jgi:hypothetical protein
METDKQQYKVVAVRLTKEQFDSLMAEVDKEKTLQKGYRISNLLRTIISEWLKNNDQ